MCTLSYLIKTPSAGPFLSLKNSVNKSVLRLSAPKCTWSGFHPGSRKPLPHRASKWVSKRHLRPSGAKEMERAFGRAPWIGCDYQLLDKATRALQGPPETGDGEKPLALPQAGKGSSPAPSPCRLPSWLSEGSVGSRCLPTSCSEGRMVSSISGPVRWMLRLFFFRWSLHKRGCLTLQPPLLGNLDVP